MSRSVHVSPELKSAIHSSIEDAYDKSGIKLSEGQVLDRAWRFYTDGESRKVEIDDEATSAIRRIEQRLEHLMLVASDRLSATEPKT